MKQIVSLYEKMTDWDAVFVLSGLGIFLSVFAFLGFGFKFMESLVADWLFFSGCFVNAIAMVILFFKKDWFFHDIASDENRH